MEERRNYARRIRTLHRALTALTTGNGLAQGNPKEAEAIVRIIKRLAVKGLARLTGGTWAPAQPLITPATLVRQPEAKTRTGSSADAEGGSPASSVRKRALSAARRG
jgi:hypothetical protein